MPKISIITPVYNEEDNVQALVEQIADVMRPYPDSFEIIAVDDGSKDKSVQVLNGLLEEYPELTVVQLSRNYGQTAAMQAAIDHCEGEIIIPIDADLQNDPADIPRLLEKLDEGYDLVSGWRKDRKDHAIKRNLVSRLANRLISRVSGVHLHDYGCSLKAYRRGVMERVRLYGEMHRFIPIYAGWYGNRITEIPVNHYPRQSGESKYGMERVLKVILDLLVVRFLHGPMAKPIYWFGGVGLIFMTLGVIFGLWSLGLKLFASVSFILTPLPMVSMLSFMLGVICILLGLIAELQIRVYFEAGGKTSYHVRSVSSSSATK